jgi:molybdate transport system substrate-binding protein
MKRIVITCAVAAICAAAAYMVVGTGGRDGMPALHVLSGAGLMKPMEEIIGEFENEHRARVIVSYGGSGELLGRLALEQPSDVFVPGAKKYVEDAGRNGWIAGGTARDITRHVPVIAVARGNPKNITGLADLARPGVTVALGEPEACAIGFLADAIMEKNGLARKMQGNIRVRAPTVNQLLLYVALGQVDASVIWEDMALWAESGEKLDIIRIPDEQNIIKTISAAVTARSGNRRLAETFNEFLDSEKARSIWTRWGFLTCAERTQPENH